MKSTRLALLAAATSAAAFAQPAPTPAASSPSFQDALLKGKPSLNARLRYESVDQEGLQDADALTLRVRLGYTTGAYHGFQAMIEGEGNVPLHSDYYDGTGTNTRGQAVIADPEIYEINQAWLSYTYEKTKATFGRQRIILDNARFVGDVAWRQNQQTFDAAFIQDRTIDKLTLTYGYLTRINRVFDDRAAQYDWRSNSHLINASYSGLPFATITGYAYLLDFDREADLAFNNSSQTYGLSVAGSPKLTDDFNLLYRAEYATQSDYGSSILSYDSEYYLGELGLQFQKKYSLSLGYEVLGSDDGAPGSGFRTPLATLHAFNGWADKFLVTPNGGLEDLYVKATATLPLNLTFLGFYHWFSAEDTSTKYGEELDLQLTYKFNKNLSFTAKAAFYRGDDEAPTIPLRADTNKYWVQADYSF
jgi:hypothetical protein